MQNIFWVVSNANKDVLSKYKVDQIRNKIRGVHLVVARDSNYITYELGISVVSVTKWLTSFVNHYLVPHIYGCGFKSSLSQLAGCIEYWSQYNQSS